MTDTDAAYSFVLGLFGATIFFASRVVEMAMNRDGSNAREEDEVSLGVALPKSCLNRCSISQYQGNPWNFSKASRDTALDWRDCREQGTREGYREVAEIVSIRRRRLHYCSENKRCCMMTIGVTRKAKCVTATVRYWIGASRFKNGLESMENRTLKEFHLCGGIRSVHWPILLFVLDQ